jgi:hypothetical protein
MTLFSRYWFTITIFIGVVIVILSLWPLATLPEVPGSDKTHHFIAYATLMFPVVIGKRERLYGYFLLYLMFSGTIELLQPLVNRYCEWQDLLANGLGLLFGWIIAKLASKFLIIA